MNGFNEEQMESALRRAPHPQAPRGLKEKLLAQTRSAVTRSQPAVARSRESWPRRWWPVLVPAGLSLVCAIVMAVQQKEIRELKQTIQVLSTNAPTPVEPVVEPKAIEASPTAASLAKQQEEEIAQLKEQAVKLSAENSQMEQMRTENQTLRAQLAAPPVGMLTPEELADMQKAKDRAMEIRCVNNMKQIGLAVRVWEGDYGDMFPPDIVSMSNELSTPKILVCPADTNRPVAANFGTYSDANCSYEFMPVPGKDNEPTRVMLRCPIHGSIGLSDGSVQIGMAKTHPEFFVQRDGKLYFEPHYGSQPR